MFNLGCDLPGYSCSVLHYPNRCRGRSSSNDVRNEENLQIRTSSRQTRICSSCHRDIEHVGGARSRIHQGGRKKDSSRDGRQSLHSISEAAHVAGCATRQCSCCPRNSVIVPTRR